MRIAVGIAGRSYTMNIRIGVLRHRRASKVYVISSFSQLFVLMQVFKTLALARSSMPERSGHAPSRQRAFSHSEEPISKKPEEGNKGS